MYVYTQNAKLQIKMLKLWTCWTLHDLSSSSSSSLFLSLSLSLLSSQIQKGILLSRPTPLLGAWSNPGRACYNAFHIMLMLNPENDSLVAYSYLWRTHKECNETFYWSAVRKFGIEKVFKFLIEECLTSDEEWADTRSGNHLPLFVIAASCENSAVSVIYHLLKRNVHDTLSGTDMFWYVDASCKFCRNPYLLRV